MRRVKRLQGTQKLRAEQALIGFTGVPMLSGLVLQALSGNVMAISIKPGHAAHLLECFLQEAQLQ